MKEKDTFMKTLLKEIELRKDYLSDTIETIYFGGGTPSVLTADEINKIISALKTHLNISAQVECTLEANPDDLSNEYLSELITTPINRLSIGIQSFNDNRLLWMNRSHTSKQAAQSVTDAYKAGFKNISIDLIFTLPDMQMNEWKAQLQQATALPVNHISCYCLTVEEKTLLGNRVKKKQEIILLDEEAQQQFLFADTFLAANGFVHYEISNYAKVGFNSKHNSSYWDKKPYLGLGPSAHSFNLISRQWNISSIKMYADAINNNTLPATTETLTIQQQYNEYVMVNLRTEKGSDLNYITANFGNEYTRYFISSAQKFISRKQLIQNENIITIDKKFWFAADSFIAELFYA